MDADKTKRNKNQDKTRDASQHSFININGVFASIQNAAIFKFEKVIDEKDLQDADSFAAFMDEDDKVRYVIGDVHKYWVSSTPTVILCRFAAENETEKRREIGLKIMGYLGINYHNQLSTGKKQILSLDTEAQLEDDGEKSSDAKDKSRNKIYYYPVLVSVLNFGNTKWKNIVLADCLDYPEGPQGEKLKAAVKKYGLVIPVLNLAFINPKRAREKGLHPDLCRLIDLLWCIRKKKKLTSRDEPIENEDEFRALIMALFKLNKEEAYKLIPRKDEQKGEVTVGSVWDQYMDIYVLQGKKEGIEEGKKEGKEEGKKEGKEEGRIGAIVSIIENYAQDYHISIEESCKILKHTYQEYLDFKSELKAIEEQEALEAQEAAS